MQSLPALTSIRFFAAASIVLFHLLGKWGLPGPQEAGLFLGVGVDLFFALSGFILAYNYRSVSSLAEGLRMVGYRIARIWPLHLVTLGAAYLLLYNPAWPAFEDVSKLWATIPLVQSWFGGHAYAFHGNSVSWTLSVELAFYLAFPLLLRLPSLWIVAVTAAVTMATVLWADAVDRQIMHTHPGAFFVLFSAGMLAARLFMSRSWAWSPKVATAVEAAALGAAAVFFLYNEDIYRFVAAEIGAKGASRYWIKAACATVFFVPAIFALAIGRGGVAKAMSVRWLVYLGEISFATYMCHQIIINSVARWGAPDALSIVLVVVLVLAVSTLLYRFVERPAQKSLRKLIDGAVAGVPAPATTGSRS
jgi:peptidoglycan/LPS O-acetylase OafA/YrhL